MLCRSVAASAPNSQCNDLMLRGTANPASPPTRELECRLVGFRTGIAEEDLVGKRLPDQFAGQFNAWRRAEQVRGVHETRGQGRLHCRRHPRVAVAKGIHADAAGKVEV
jgi:hypothetical protein